MRCPFCGEGDTQVLDTRSVEDGYTIRRRRKCNKCGKRFTTYERRDITKTITVIKKDGRREPFKREKILEGLTLATVRRQISREKLEEIVNLVESEILEEGENEIPSRRIGEIVLRHLRDLDPVSYVRFASVYREFESVDEFMEELERLRKNG